MFSRGIMQEELASPLFVMLPAHIHSRPNPTRNLFLLKALLLQLPALSIYIILLSSHREIDIPIVQTAIHVSSFQNISGCHTINLIKI